MKLKRAVKAWAMYEEETLGWRARENSMPWAHPVYIVPAKEYEELVNMKKFLKTLKKVKKDSRAGKLDWMKEKKK